jgi:diguanylate cyclase (GGDEF)-like protein
MKAAAPPSTAPEPQRFRSLRRKVFLPFLLIILMLCTAAIWGSFRLADTSLKNSADQRLAAAQKALYSEFKSQESILQTYAVILQQLQSLTEHFQYESEVGILRDRLFNTLEKAHVSTAFYPADIHGLVPQESMVSLFDQVRRSRQPRVRFSNEFGDTPVLMAAAPIYNQNEISQIILLQIAMGEAFLHRVTSPLDVSASLMTINGQIMASSSTSMTDVKLTPAQITLISSGQPLYLDHEKDKGVKRYLFSIIPLGRSDMVLLSLEASLEKTTERQNTTILRMILIMVAVIILGSIYYFRRISGITQPVLELRNAAEALSRGNLNYRIREISNDELGQIAVVFNKMAIGLEENYQERSDQDITAALAHEDDKTKLILKRKELERDKISAELSIIQRETSALYQLNHAMTVSIELSALFDRVLQVLNEILSCDHLVLLVHNQGDSVLEVVRTTGIDANALSKVRFTFNQGVTGEAAQSQRMIYVKNIDEDERNLSYHGLVVTRGSMLSVPLVVKGRLVGVINLHKRQVEAFSASEQKLIQAVANQTAVTIYITQLLEKSRNLSLTDELTGLSNRRYFQEILKREVAQARRFSSIFSIIMCDIDGFKQHKSNLGNLQTDALLRQVGKSFLKNTRGIDLVSRFGNDQFIILLPKTDKEGGVATAEKLRKRIVEEDFSRQINPDLSIKVTLSFGVTEFPNDSKNIYELLSLADSALFAAKQNGCNCTVAWEGHTPGYE